MPVWSGKRLHPLVAAAAVAIILACLMILATVTGVLSPIQNVLVTAHAATPVIVSARPAGAVSPAPIKNKPLPALSISESLAPGEAVVDMDANASVPAPTKAVPKMAMPPRAPSVAPKPSNGVASRTAVSPATRRALDSANAAPSPRIIPVYRDMNSIDPSIVSENHHISSGQDEENDSDYIEKPARAPIIISR